MKKSLIILAILIVAALIAWVSFFSREAKERRIANAITEANYCEVASDCELVVQSYCPFGCHIHVNKNEAARIWELLDGYESKCMYSCVEFKGVDCVNNTCQLVE